MIKHDDVLNSTTGITVFRLATKTVVLLLAVKIISREEAMVELLKLCAKKMIWRRTLHLTRYIYCVCPKFQTKMRHTFSEF